MTRQREIRNVPASVHDRLLNLARSQQADFNLLLQRYAAERFLYRLGLSSEVDHFILKGATLFLVWAGVEYRATQDIDLQGTGPTDLAAIREAVTVICQVECPEDGLVFNPESITVREIREQQEHGGIRVTLAATLEKGIIHLQVDIGFGDPITPRRHEAEYPTLLDHPVPRIWIYPREAFIAEKFEAMVRLGPGNTRMKDFWDVVALAGQCEFDGESLRTAIDETCRARGTTLATELPDAIRPAFYDDGNRVRQWDAFRARTRATIDVPDRFDETGERVREFLGPIRESVVRGEPFTRVWPAGGPWQVATLEGGVGDV